ncbi:MAG: TRAP transporter substrate-binding protein [Pseudomonadota bacterium]
MKKMKVLSLVFSLCLVLAFPFTAMAETITLSFSDQNPDISWGPVHATQPWVKQVEEATKGRVKIQIYPSQTLAKGRQNWKAVKDGIADMSWNVMPYYTGLTPYADVIGLPGLPFNSAADGSVLLWKLFEKFPEVSGQFADNKVLILHTSPVFSLLTSKKQVKVLEDMKGMKVRSVGGNFTEVLKKLGAIPMMIPMPDCYISMQKGVIDGMGAAWEPIPGFRLQEVTKYITDNVPFGASYFAVVMNKNKWNSLPKDIQDAIMSVSGLEGSRNYGKNFFDSAVEPVKKMIKDKGLDIGVYLLPEQEKAKWIEVGVKPVWESWIQRMEKDGYPKAREILDAAIKMAKE